MNIETDTKSKLVDQIKTEFIDFCGLLSIDEIASNIRLIRLIEESERSLIQANYGG